MPMELRKRKEKAPASTRVSRKREEKTPAATPSSNLDQYLAMQRMIDGFCASSNLNPRGSSQVAEDRISDSDDLPNAPCRSKSPEKNGKKKRKTKKKNEKVPTKTAEVKLPLHELAFRRLPPFVCESDKFMEIKGELEKESSLNGKWTIRSLDGAFRVYPQSYYSAKKVKEVLFRNDVQFHTYCEKALRPKLIFARGFDARLSEEEVMDSLKKMALAEVEWVAVTRIKTKISTARGIPSNVFKLKCISKKGFATLLKIRQVGTMRVHLEVFKTGAEAVQCFRCQAIGHISINCARKQRCVKCTEEHSKDKCPASVNKGISKLKCIFCGLQHPSSFIGCFKRQEEIRRYKAVQENVTGWKLQSKMAEKTNDTVSLGAAALAALGIQTPTSSPPTSSREKPRCVCQLAAKPTPVQRSPPIVTLPTLQPQNHGLPSSMRPPESSLDDVAFRLFGRSWRIILSAVWSFESSFHEAPVGERETLMLSFLTGGLFNTPMN